MSVIDTTKPWSGYVKRWTVAADPTQPRTEFEPEALKRLGKSMKRKQQVPCIVIPQRMADHPHVEWQLIDGERRWRAAEMADIDDLWVSFDPKIYGESGGNDDVLAVSGDDLHAASLTANFCREGHTKMEISNAIARQMAAGRTHEQIADMVGKSESWVEQYRSLQDLHPRLQQMLDVKDRERKLVLSVALILVKHPVPKQLEMWERFRGLNPKEAQHRLRVTNTASQGRTPSSNRRYIRGRVELAERILRQLRDVGEVMMRQLSPEDALSMVSRLSEVRALAKAFETRLEQRAESKGGGQ